MEYNKNDGDDDDDGHDHYDDNDEGGSVSSKVHAMSVVSAHFKTCALTINACLLTSIGLKRH
jgi:hypothetical protein